jgi:hypothetical protein
MESRSKRVACSLTPSELGHREQAWENLIQARERVAGGIRLTVDAAAMSSVRELVDLERECCPWIKFNLDRDSLTLTATGVGEELLVHMFG